MSGIPRLLGVWQVLVWVLTIWWSRHRLRSIVSRVHAPPADYTLNAAPSTVGALVGGGGQPKPGGLVSQSSLSAGECGSIECAGETLRV